MQPALESIKLIAMNRITHFEQVLQDVFVSTRQCGRVQEGRSSGCRIAFSPVISELLLVMVCVTAQLAHISVKLMTGVKIFSY